VTVQTVGSLSCGACGSVVRGTMLIKVDGPAGERSSAIIRFDHCGALECIRNLVLESYSHVGLADPTDWWSTDVQRLSESFGVDSMLWSDDPDGLVK